MAILIPSKHIYGDIENPKVRNNLIDKVSIEQVVITPNDDYDVTVFNKDYTDFTQGDYVFDDANREDIDLQATYKHTAIGSTNDVMVGFVAYCGCQDYKVTDFELTIPRLYKNSLINSIKFGEDKEGNNNIKYTVYCSKKTGTATASLRYKTQTFTINYISLGDGTIDEQNSYSLPSEISYTHNGTNVQTGLSAEITATAKVYKPSSIFTAKPTITDDDIYINFFIASQVTVVKFGASPTIPTASGAWSITGTYETYIPKQINITIYGDTIGINIADGTVTYGDGKNPYTISRSELIQNNSSFAQSMANKIISEYSKGKETATIRCDIGEYYFYNKTNPQVGGKKVISASDEGLSMTFTEGDIVIPMIPSASGGDEPMSRYQDGTAKEFRVVGTSIINDGAVWQKIYLQEM